MYENWLKGQKDRWFEYFDKKKKWFDKDRDYFRVILLSKIFETPKILRSFLRFQHSSESFNK